MHDKMYKNLLQVVETVQSNTKSGSIVKDIITDQLFFISGLFLDQENEKGEVVLFELPKSKLEVVR